MTLAQTVNRVLADIKSCETCEGHFQYNEIVKVLDGKAYCESCFDELEG